MVNMKTVTENAFFEFVHSKRFISILLAILVAFIFEYLSIFDYGVAKTTIGTSSEAELNIQEARLDGATFIDSRYYAESDDPKIFFDRVDSYVNGISIFATNLSSAVLDGQVFYSYDGTTYTEEQSVVFTLRGNQNVTHIILNQNVKSIRIDIGQKGDNCKIVSIIQNPSFFRVILMNIANVKWKRILIYTIFLLLVLFFREDPKLFFEKIFRYRWTVGMLVVLGCTLFKLHGSSIGYLAEVLSGQDISRLWGEPRPIRSDEYVVFTEMALSQVRSGFHWFSDIWGYSLTDMSVVYGQISKSIMILYRPFMIGYLVAGAEYGLAFYWSSRLVFLLLVSFEMGRIIFHKISFLIK